MSTVVFRGVKMSKCKQKTNGNAPLVGGDESNAVNLPDHLLEQEIHLVDVSKRVSLFFFRRVSRCNK
jgi:hypothetical protein